LRVVADTGPLVAAVNRRDEAHRLAAALVTQLGTDLLVPLPVAVEVDHLLRGRVGPAAARLFIRALASGEHSVAFATPALLRDAADIDAQYANLDLGLVDGIVMAIAFQHRLPVLTFDFAHFRAAPSRSGAWRLVVDESQYAEALRFTRS